MTNRASYINNGLQVLAHDDLPPKFTWSDFHAVAFKLFGYVPSTTKGMLTALKSEGYVEEWLGKRGYKQAIYVEARV